MAVVQRKTPVKAGRRSANLAGYLQQSQRPLTILAFLLPFVVLHELGARYYGTGVAAASLLRLAASYLGVYGSTIPAILLVLTLLSWHLIRRDGWEVKSRNLAMMAGESFLFALPIFAISLICQQFLPLATGMRPPLGAMWSLSLGAGVYEELLFRLYLCAVLGVLAEHALRLKGTALTVFVVAASSVLFSLYHYLDHEQFALFTFVFRSLAGAYFAGLIAARGFGITAGAHAFYDLIVVTLARS